MKIFIFVPFLACCLCAVSGDARSPNVVIVLTDDQGSVDMGCYAGGGVNVG